MLNKILRCVICFAMIVVQWCVAGVNVRQATSSIEIKNGAHFVTKNKILNYKGALRKEPTGIISGGDFYFEDALFDDAGNKMMINGSINPGTLQTILLDGNKTFRGVRGTVVQAIRVSGLGNRIEGIMQVSEPLVLADANSELICALYGRMSDNIILNGGRVILEEDLAFIDDAMITGSGFINLNERTLSLGASELVAVDDLYLEDARHFELNADFHLAATWTFSGTNIFYGRGHTLWFENGADLVVEKNSHLTLSNVIIRGLHGTAIRCLDEDCVINLCNVQLILDDDFSFTTGALEFFGDSYLMGPHIFAYQSAQTSTVNTYASLSLEKGVTLSVDPIWNEKFIFDAGEMSEDPWLRAKSFFAFDDATSKLVLNGGTLYATTTGLKLTKGTLRVYDTSAIGCDLDDQFHMETGIILGDNDPNLDMKLEIDSGMQLQVLGGALTYKNVNEASLMMKNDASKLSIGSGSKLKLHQNFRSEKGIVEFHNGSTLARAEGKDLLSAIHMLGAVSYECCYN